jgi:hypothetical protein
MTARHELSVPVTTGMIVPLVRLATTDRRAPNALVTTATTVHPVPSVPVTIAMIAVLNVVNAALRRSTQTSPRSHDSRRKTMSCSSDSKHRPHLRLRLKA